MPSSVVPLGSVVLALIKPSVGREVAFNRWYGLDHYYTAGTAAPGVFSAGRFIGPADSGPGPRPHLALYFVLPGHEEARASFATAQVERAAADGRMFADREHLYNWTHRPFFTWHAGGHDVPTSLALDHRFPALSVALLDADDDDRLTSAVGGAASEASSIAQVLGLAPVAEIVSSTWRGPVDPGRRRAVVAFHSCEPAVAGTELAGLLTRIAGEGGASVVWAGAFHPAVFGTDTHVAD